jgi:hypothetical protein
MEDRGEIVPMPLVARKTPVLDQFSAGDLAVGIHAAPVIVRGKVAIVAGSTGR